jgi:DNA repair protein RecO (recombination protein O)
MPETYCERAIVLRRRVYRGYDSRVSVYTRERGKIDLLVRGALRPTSKLASHLEPLTLVDIMVISGRIAYVGGSVSRDCFPNIKNDYDKLQAAGQAFHHLNRLLKEQAVDEKIFDVMASFLSLLNSQSADPVWYNWLSELFIYKIIDILGYGLNIELCRRCQKPFTNEEVIFSFMDHSLFCKNCASDLNSDQVYIFSKLPFLRSLVNQPLSAAVAISKRLDLEGATEFLNLRTKILIEEIT